MCGAPENTLDTKDQSSGFSKANSISRELVDNVHTSVSLQK